MISLLYVDDEPALLEIGKLFLERSGQFSVDTITSAPAALALLSTGNYDAIISDYQMPGMDGIEFLKKVRISGNTIPFILFTGRGREEVVIQALNEGADFYLQKGGEPVPQFTELAHQVRQAVQQRRSEASIRDHERREADIINFLPDATFAIDKEGTVIAWNRAMEEMTGVKAAEILEKGTYEYAIPGYHERQPVLIDLVLHEDPAVLSKYPLITRDGQTLISEITSPFLYNGRGATLRVIATPLYSNRGIKTGAIESLRDITESRQGESELRAAFEQITAAGEKLRSQYEELERSERQIRESETRFREQYQNNPLAIFTWQHRDGDFILVDCNKTADTLTSGRSRNYIGRAASDLYATRPELLSEIRQCFSDRSVISKNLVSEHFLPGRFIHTTATFIPPDLIMVHMEDISDRKAAEEALREANRKLNLLYQITRHDINNQILAMTSFLELLHEKVPEPALNYYFTWITQSINRISAMVRFTKVYETLGITAPAWQDLRTILDSAVKEAPLGNVRMKNDLPKGAEIFADPLIEKVFYNLMDNAVRYGGKITTIRFFWEDRNGKRILVCEDDGAGVQPADKERIFNRGFGKNTGLGLFLAREVLSITGITIRETGEAGKGARFEMTVPEGVYRRAGEQ